MTATHFWDLTRDNGLPVTVEYSMCGWEPVVIWDAWPNTPGHDRLARWHNHFAWGNHTNRLMAGAIDLVMRLDSWWRASLTDAEDERFCAYIAEHHEETQ